MPTPGSARARLFLARLANLQGEIGRRASAADVAEMERLQAELLPRAGTAEADDALIERYRQAQARVRAASAAARAVPSPEVGFEAIRRVLLRNGGTLLEYWLGEDHSIVWVIIRLLSAATAIASRATERRPQSSRRVGVFADPHINAVGKVGQRAPPGLRTGIAGRVEAVGPIPFTAKEARAIASVVPEELVDLWLQAQATRDRVLSSAGTYRVVHFATHGLVSADHPETSGLVLSGGAPGEPVGYLGLADIQRLRLQADLVVLSACETALGLQIRGEGLMSLTHGFLSAGARRVIATLWQVNDASTSELMAELYTQMFRHGASPAAALRAAQLTQIGSDPTRHPYFWAAFGVYGE